MRGKTGVLMLNMGGPSKLEEVPFFLKNLFSDYELVPLPFKRWLPALITKRRTGKIQNQYRAIGGGSPIGFWTNLQGKATCQLLEESLPEHGPYRNVTAFRYSHPLTEEALAEIKESGVEQVVVFSQYAQYSCVTSGSSINELVRQIRKDPGLNRIRWSLIDRWATNEGLITAFADNIHAAVKRLSQEDLKKTIILFSAHSLPISVVDKGDTYPYEISASAQSVMARLSHVLPYQIVWQSKVGFAKWLRPSFSETLKLHRSKGIENVIVVPISFTSDHVETLYELDIEYQKEAHELGYKQFIRTQSMNDNPTFINGLAKTVHSHLTGSKLPSAQFTIRCPGCTNNDCLTSREFFSQ